MIKYLHMNEISTFTNHAMIERTNPIGNDQAIYGI